MKLFTLRYATLSFPNHIFVDSNHNHDRMQPLRKKKVIWTLLTRVISKNVGNFEDNFKAKFLRSLFITLIIAQTIRLRVLKMI